MDHEAFESRNAGLGERGQFRRIAVHHATPGSPVDPGVSPSRCALGFEGCDIDCFGNAVQGHVDEGGDAACGCSAGGGIEALPVAAGIVDVYVGIDQAGQKQQVAEVVVLPGTAGIAPGTNRGDLSALHDKRGGAEAVGRQHAS